MRVRKDSIRARVKGDLPIVFTDEKLSAYAGIELFRRFVDRSGFAERLRQVDYVVTNGEWAGKPDDVDVNVMHLQASVVHSLDGATEYSLDDFRQNHTGTPIHAVAGIGNPQRFFRMLGTLGINAEPHGFSDHHSFTAKDFETIGAGSVIIMTEKDAVKCRTLGLENAWYMPVETHLSDEFEAIVKQQLARLTKDNK